MSFNPYDWTCRRKINITVPSCIDDESLVNSFTIEEGGGYIATGIDVGTEVWSDRGEIIEAISDCLKQKCFYKGPYNNDTVTLTYNGEGFVDVYVAQRAPNYGDPDILVQQGFSRIPSLICRTSVDDSSREIFYKRIKHGESFTMHHGYNTYSRFAFAIFSCDCQESVPTNHQILLKIGESSGSSDFDFHLDNRSAKFPSQQDDGGDLRFCYSSDTEILTEDGWILLKDLVEQKKKIKVATLNPETNKIEYHYPLDYQKFYYEGKMLLEDGRAVNYLVTPEHRIWARTHWKKKSGKDFQIFEARKLPKHVEYQVSAEWEGEEKKYFVLPSVLKRNGYYPSTVKKEKKILMDDWLDFFGFWLAEGCCFKNKSHYTIYLTQKDKFILEKYRKILEKYGFNTSYLKTKRGWTLRITDIQLWNYLKQFGKSNTKYIPREFLNLSKRQLKILFNAMVDGDGHRRKRNIIYYTVSKKLADNVSELALKLGYSCVITKRKAKGTIAFGKYIRKFDGYVCSLTPRRTFEAKYNRKWIDYKGFVYDITVPNHIIFVRRNGKQLWSGNCSDDGTTLLPFWVEKVEGTAPNRTAYVWVKVNTDLNTDQSIFCYFGNPNAENVSNGEETFELFNVQGITAFYHLDEDFWSSVEGEVKDEIGVNNGTAHGGATTVEYGKFGRAGSFDGSDDYVDCGNDESLNLDDEFSIEAWVMPRRKDTQETFLSKGNCDDNDGWTLDYSSGNKFSFRLRNNDNYGIFSNAVVYNSWYHVVAVRYFGLIRLYVNGVLEGSRSDVEGISALSSASLKIGCRSGSDPDYFKGLIDEVRIYNRALTEEEISKLYNGYMQNMGGIFNVRKPDPLISLSVEEIEVLSPTQLQGTVCDKNGNPITGTAVKIFFFDKDTGELLGSTTSNSEDGSWSYNFGFPAGTKILTVFTLEGTYGEDTDIAGAEFLETE